MAAFTNRVTSALSGVLNSLEQREAHWTCQIDMTTDEALEMLVGEADAAVLKRAHVLTQSYRTNVTVSVRDLGFGERTLSISGCDWLAPKQARLPAPGATCHPGWDKIRAVLGKRQEIATRWKAISSAIAYLDSVCSNPVQVRFHMPAIVALMQLDEMTLRQARKIAEFRVPQSIPRIPDQIRTFCRESAEWVSTALLYPPVSNDGTRPVSIS